MKPFATPDDLDAILDDAWARITRGVKDRRSAFHSPAVATSGAADVRQRIMVLRGADRAMARLRFHTDRRSAKVEAIGSGAPVSVLGYDTSARIQIIMQGHAVVVSDSGADVFWDNTALSSRRGYLVQPGPGTPTDEVQSGLPAAMRDRVPTDAESEAGRANFAVLHVQVSRIEWLELNATGNRRAAFSLHDDKWTRTWLIP